MAILIVVLFAEYTSSMKNCIVYYTDNFTAYSYDTSKMLKKKVVLDGYKKVNFYLPVENGYVAVVKDFNDDLCLIYNDDVLFYNECIYDLTLVGNYIFYCTSNDNFHAFNYITKTDYEIIKSNRLGYSAISDYVYYSDRNSYETFYEDNNIYAIDCKANEPKPVIIDKGIIRHNTNDGLIYSKADVYYHYSFDKMTAQKIEKINFIKDTFSNRNYGSITIGDNEFDIHLVKPAFHDPFTKDENDIYVYKLLQGEYYCIVDDCRGYLKISNSKKHIYIPTSKSRAISIDAVEYNNKIYYPEKKCTYKELYF